MKRFIIATLASLLALGCAAADETLVDPSTDPTWTPEEPNVVITFDDFPGEPVDYGPGMGFVSESEREKFCGEHPESLLCLDETERDNELQRLEQPVKHCYTGPGFAVAQQNLGNTNRFQGPCYQKNPDGTAFDCAFPGWQRTTSLRWKNEVALTNAFCTVGMTGSGVTGIAPSGRVEIAQAFDAWKAAGANFKNIADSESGQFSVGCAPSGEQDNSTNVLAAAGPWGNLRVDGPVSQIGFTGAGSQASLETNYPVANPVQALAWDAGIWWLYDRNMNTKANSCGGNATQKLNKYRTMLYLLGLHEIGHMLGFAHAQTGIMKPSILCEDLGDGSSSTAPRISVPGIYGNLYATYINSRSSSAIPANYFADTSFCTTAPKPLAGNNHSAEFQELINNN